MINLPARLGPGCRGSEQMCCTALLLPRVNWEVLYTARQENSPGEQEEQEGESRGFLSLRGLGCGVGDGGRAVGPVRQCLRRVFCLVVSHFSTRETKMFATFKSRWRVRSFPNFVALCNLATFTPTLDLHKDDGHEWADGPSPADDVIQTLFSPQYGETDGTVTSPHVTHLMFCLTAGGRRSFLTQQQQDSPVEHEFACPPTLQRHAGSVY